MFQQKIGSPPNGNRSFVAAVSGSGLLKSHLTGKETPIKARQSLFPGDSVRSTAGIVTLSLYGKAVALKRSPVWFFIIPPPRLSAGGRFKPYADLRRAGRRKGLLQFNLVNAPVPETVVWPDRFRLKWNALPPGRTIRVRVCAGSEVIWPPSGKEAVLPAKGSELISEELRARLREKQAQEYTGNLRLQWTEETEFPPPLDLQPAALGKVGGALSFRLLSLAQEKKVKTDMDDITRMFDPLTQLLYQARLFEQEGLTAEAAEAYEALARRSPERTDFKETALRFLYENGLDERAARLESLQPR